MRLGERPQAADAPPRPQLDGTSPAAAVSKPVGGEEAPPAGGPPSESELLERHSELVYNLALRLVGSPQDAEDLAQDALLRALKALPRFRGECQVSTWLYRITVNTWKNRVRAEKRRGFWKTVSFGLLAGGDDGEEGELNLPADEPALDRGLDAADTAAAVQRALGDLEPESRAVMVLRDMEGLAYDEIALQLGIPEGTVKSRLSRAREALKARLRKHLGA